MSIVTQKVNPNPRLTEYLVGLRIFQSSPVVVVDVGSRGGFEPQWNVYGDSVRLIGFEPDIEECDKLNAHESRLRRHYPVALHRDKGTRSFYVTKHDAASSFYKPYSRFLDRLPESVNRTIKEELIFETIDLDSFLGEESIGAVDFIKLDTEGAEYDILLGAKMALSKSVFGISLEMLFNRQRIGEPLFSEIDLFLREQGFVVYDLPIFRCARTVLSPHMFSDNAGPTDHGQATWTQAIYFRDAFDEIKFGHLGDKWDPLRILKLASVLELFNFEDCALELINLYRLRLSNAGLDPATMINLLVPPVDGKFVSWKEYCDHIKAEGPPRYIDSRRVSKEEYEAYIKNKTRA